MRNYCKKFVLDLDLGWFKSVDCLFCGYLGDLD